MKSDDSILSLELLDYKFLRKISMDIIIVRVRQIYSLWFRHYSIKKREIGVGYGKYYRGRITPEFSDQVSG